eukprot:3968114-Pyramimonas_sp.AAC.1
MGLSGGSFSDSGPEIAGSLSSEGNVQLHSAPELSPAAKDSGLSLALYSAQTASSTPEDRLLMRSTGNFSAAEVLAPPRRGS